MPSTSSTSPVTDEERRWVVIGVCLNKVLTPALRKLLATEMPKWYNDLCKPPTEIDKQVHGAHQRNFPPSILNLNYKSINNNRVHRKAHAFDYAVKDPLSLAKLFVQPSMCHFTGFDETMDASAVLSLICEAAPFAGAAAHAKTVRSDIRNEWAHCKFAAWTEAKFDASFKSMETLLQNLGLSAEDEEKLCDELNSWKDKGFELCFGQSVDMKVFPSHQDKVDKLCEQVEKLILEKEQVAIVLKRLRSNGARLARLIIDQGTEILRKYFDSIHSPANLPAWLNDHREKLQTLQKEGVLSSAHMNFLFPPEGKPASSDFDITLLFILVRNFCDLTPSATTGSCDSNPPSTNTSPEAVLDRIKYYRKVVYGHKKSTEVDDKDFNTYWNEISDVLKLLSIGLGVDLSGDDIKNLKTSSLDLADEYRYIDLLKNWHENEDEDKRTLRRMDGNVEETKNLLHTLLRQPNTTGECG